ncbi:hypothetical protein [Acidovorax sp. A1169]|uniref:hypothetical protein n=1 Tax=Acidovorax sp. A1169 TaxID=3059524 RepID=UPI0027379126|nr:hypothetical protein [Acidovorax sp. A1169]
MPMEYLKVIAVEMLPFDVNDEAGVDKLRVLEAAGMVEVQFTQERGSPPARVVAITGLGRASLLAEVAKQVIRQRSPEVSSAWAALS